MIVLNHFSPSSSSTSVALPQPVFLNYRPTQYSQSSSWSLIFNHLQCHQSSSTQLMVILILYLQSSPINFTSIHLFRAVVCLDALIRCSTNSAVVVIRTCLDQRHIHRVLASPRGNISLVTSQTQSRYKSRLSRDAVQQSDSQRGTETPGHIRRKSIPSR